MAQIIKPRTLGIMTKAERRPHGASFVVGALGMFDLAAPDPDRFESEQAIWLLAAEELPPGIPLDLAMPKPNAEVLVAGHAASAEAVERMGLSWEIGGLHGQLLVTGDRYWQLLAGAPVPTPPIPFRTMPIVPARCFGGPGHPHNAAGLGFRAEDRLAARVLAPLPNVETPARAVRSIGDRPEPASFGALALDSPERLKYAGTYDEAWRRTLAPGLAADVDPRFFCLGGPAQQLGGFLAGDEAYRLRGFAADAPLIEARLPGFRVRCFLGWTDAARPVVEVPMQIDTLWLVAGARRGILVYRGAAMVEDIEALDVADLLLAYERLADEPRPASHYLEVRALRTDPQSAPRHALAEHQLTPARDPAVVAATLERRRLLARERRERLREGRRWFVERQLEGQGLPRILWPPFEEEAEDEEDDVLLPTPEEIEAGEIDVGAMFDAFEARQRELEETMAAAQEREAATLGALAAEGAGPGAVDALLASLAGADVPAQIDAQVAAIPSPEALPFPLEGTQHATLAAARDWRETILAAIAGRDAIDDEDAYAAARARFLRLPEGSPLAPVRGILADLPIGELPSLPPAPDGEPLAPSEAPTGLDFEGVLAALDGASDMPEARSGVRGALRDVDAQVAKALPNLSAGEGGALQALATFAASQSPPPPRPDELPAVIADLRDRTSAGLDEAEAGLAEGIAKLRVASPAPTYPEKPLGPAVARRFGGLIAEACRGGTSLAGRDLAGADLSGQDLSGADLRGALMERVRLDGARLAGADLSGATLAGGSLHGTDFSAALLEKTNFGEASGEGPIFRGARLAGAVAMKAKLPGAIFDEAELSQSNWTGVELPGASFAGARIADLGLLECELSDAVFRGAALSRTVIMLTPCARASFAGAAFDEVAFVQAALARADFRDIRFRSLSFAAGIDLTGASFARASGRNLSFFKTDLGRASFAEADVAEFAVTDGDLSAASFRLASLKGAILSRNAMRATDFFAANLLEARLDRADLSGASLRAANLNGANLSDALLHGADLSDANLDRTVLAGPSRVAA